MSKKPTNITSLESQRRELDRQIRAAKRAEKKAADAALMSARQDLGVWLTNEVSADNLDKIARLRSALEQDNLRSHLRAQIVPPAQDTRQVTGGESHG